MNFAFVHTNNMFLFFFFFVFLFIGSATAFVMGRLPGSIGGNRWLLVSVPRSEGMSLHASDGENEDNRGGNQPTESSSTADRVWRPKSPTQDIRGGAFPSSSSASSSSSSPRSVEQEWKSGEVFKNNNQQNRRRRNDPWWMREEEKTNPRVLPPYKPWWAVSDEITPVSVIETMKVAELKEECEKLGLTPKGKKDELLHLLRETKALYDLSDANFRQVNPLLFSYLLLLVTLVPSSSYPSHLLLMSISISLPLFNVVPNDRRVIPRYTRKLVLPVSLVRKLFLVSKHHHKRVTVINSSCCH